MKACFGLLQQGKPHALPLQTQWPSCFHRKVGFLRTFLVVSTAPRRVPDFQHHKLLSSFTHQKKIKIISARDKFKKMYPDNTFWKKLVFKELMSEYSKTESTNEIKNIISIGDADYELHALINLYDEFGENKKYYKSVKLINDPSYDTIIDQLEVLNKTAIKMINLRKHLDLKFVDLV